MTEVEFAGDGGGGEGLRENTSSAEFAGDVGSAGGLRVSFVLIPTSAAKFVARAACERIDIEAGPDRSSQSVPAD